MERWSGRTAVVTGASGGIGAAVAVALADAGLNVLGLARRPQLVEELQGQVRGAGRIFARRCDVTCPEEVGAAFSWATDTLNGVDVLVNNAAVIYHGHITELGTNPLTVEELTSEIDTNVKSVVLCSRHAATSMKQRDVSGHIININSVAGHYVPSAPVFNVYPGTKHAVTAITGALRNEFCEFAPKIKITSISPGLVETEMAQAHRMPELRALISSQPVLQPRDVADAVLYALATPPHVSIDELTITPLGGKKL